MLRKFMTMALVTGLALAPAAAIADDEKMSKNDRRRAEIDEMEKSTLDALFAANEGAKALFDSSKGYAVFENLKVALGVSGGGGSGVAVSKAGGGRTYMKMGTAGVGFGLGGKRYQVVFLFETEELFNNFVEKGWQADTSANAAAGSASASAESTFSGGLKIYQLTEKGLMANAEVAGTKYWKYDKLN